MSDDPVYEVLLDGGKVGPYDRRTIVGMRIKNTLTSEHVLLARDGSRLTVADLVRTRPRDNSFQPNRSGSYSLVQATYSASLVDVKGPPHRVPAFRGEVEARVQTDVLRIAGRFRKAFGWKEDRVKLPLADIVHARVRNTLVDLWLRMDGRSGFLRLTLELFTPQAAGEFVDWLPGATPWNGAEGPTASTERARTASPWMWVALIVTAVAVGGVLVALLSHRFY
ncbi:hypothetical protein [Ramlibacter sp.]|uniref:hypothetical protein n=1 Tax=Ramlibacter sp. TaxID=1917967 RepID=UPI002D7E89EE|nr:hypothetical protein [Ramlibacter sp.]